MSEICVYYRGNLSTESIHPSGEKIITNGPGGQAFSPTDLIALGLGSCILTIMGFRAKQLGFDLEKAQASVKKQMSPTPRKIKALHVVIEIQMNLSESDRSALEKAGLECPVHLSLSGIEQHVEFKWRS